MRQEELSKKITELTNETKAGKLTWRLDVQTTEANEPETKPVEQEDGTAWTLDECYVSYDCNYRGTPFSMITYELIKTAGDKTATSNLVFVPPLGVRCFDLRTLLPHSVEASAVLLEQIHQLWLVLMERYKTNPESVKLTVRPGELTIED